MATTPDRQESLATIRAWLVQQGAADVARHHMARAMGTSPQETDTLLQTPATAETLLNLDRLEQYRHLAMAHRVWPHCIWLDWHHEQQSHPIIQEYRFTLQEMAAD